MTVTKVCLGCSCSVRGNNETFAFFVPSLPIEINFRKPIIKKMEKLSEEKF